MLFITGIAAHHMLKINGANYSLYQRKLTKLGPTLGQLFRINRVIWLNNQYPTFDLYAYIFAHKYSAHNYRHICRENSDV